jgi:hypothetical protein
MAKRAGALVAAALLLAGTTVVTAAVIQQGNLRITVLSQIQPFLLPRHDPAPIAVFVSGHVAAPSGGVPPQLKRMTIRINRHGLLERVGLPICHVPQIQPSSSERALDACGSALVGSGYFWARIVLPDQAPYPTHGRLLIFNGRQGGRPVILAHIFTSNPFDTSFVVVFRIHRIAHGRYGTELSASLPAALGSWGFVDRLKLTLRRNYRYLGKARSYFNASCPAAEGVRSAVFPIALASFHFAGGEQLSTTVSKSCGVKGP